MINLFYKIITMTKKDKKKELIKEDIKNESENLKELEKESKLYDELEKNLNLLQKENKKLEKQLKEQEEILKNTQLQYISLKNEFDSFLYRIKINEQKQKDEMFEKIISKIIPIIELFISSYQNLPEEFKNHKWTEWIDIINKKIDLFLGELNVEFIRAIWEEPNEVKHEIIDTEFVDDDKKKGKIIKEIKKWYILKNDNKEKVLMPSKVIVWI